MNDNNVKPLEHRPIYAACQNGCILDTFNTREEAVARVQEEIKKDWLQILIKKKLRKLLAKTGSVALHDYSVITIQEVEKIQ